ncbi:hypothetical protein D9611_002847 [Ephemerocybe angulata]|uniref:Uncharacterized protein n=1 Tax=Ephemerocybe angulata TaxID=980116 RepID=A0A8H5C1I4_9AGAR|nr:hypothetical protein D9611_002847 [Tulosesus angulatus]
MAVLKARVTIVAATRVRHKSDIIQAEPPKTLSTPSACVSESTTRNLRIHLPADGAPPNATQAHVDDDRPCASPRAQARSLRNDDEHVGNGDDGGRTKAAVDDGSLDDVEARIQTVSRLSSHGNPRLTSATETTAARSYHTANVISSPRTSTMTAPTPPTSLSPLPDVLDDLQIPSAYLPRPQTRPTTTTTA